MGTELRVGIVGVGTWGRNIYRAFCRARRCRVVAVCDQVADFAKLEPSVGEAKVTRDFGELLTVPGLDAVVVATNSSQHAAMTKRALLAGKHVFVEKPMALNTADAAEVASIAEERKLKLMVGHLLLYHPAVEYIKRMLEDGALGDVFYIYTRRVNLGMIRSDENSWSSLAPHDVSVVLHFLDQEPIQVAAHGATYIQAADGIEDVVFANLLFSTGQSAAIHASWLDPHKERVIVVVGSKKMVVFDDMDPREKIRIYDRGFGRMDASDGPLAMLAVRQGDVMIPHVSWTEPLVREVDHFVTAVLNNRAPLSDGRNGLAVVRILEAGHRSLASGGFPVRLATAAK